MPSFRFRQDEACNSNIDVQNHRPTVGFDFFLLKMIRPEANSSHDGFVKAMLLSQLGIVNTRKETFLFDLSC